MRPLAGAVELLLVAAWAAAGQQGPPAPKPGSTNPPPPLARGASNSRMTFFVTSRGLGKGAGPADLEKADAHCQSLAAAEGAGDHTWRAYLGAPPRNGKAGVVAIQRIGKGPWY